MLTHSGDQLEVVNNSEYYGSVIEIGGSFWNIKSLIVRFRAAFSNLHHLWTSPDMRLLSSDVCTVLESVMFLRVTYSGVSAFRMPGDFFIRLPVPPEHCSILR